MRRALLMISTTPKEAEKWRKTEEIVMLEVVIENVRGGQKIVGVGRG
jgi:hypothetical protein